MHSSSDVFCYLMCQINRVFLSEFKVGDQIDFLYRHFIISILIREEKVKFKNGKYDK